MATRGRIGILNDDGSVDSIYSHWDNYPSHTGKILVQSYQKEHKVRELIALGNLSSLDNAIGEKHPFDNPYPYASQAWHEHEALYAGMCTFYGRDRGETDVESIHSDTVTEYLSIDCWADYFYLFKNDAWYVCDGGVFRLVVDVLKEEEA